MARFGKLPVQIEDGVEVKLEDHFVNVKGPKGELKVTIPKGIEVVLAEKELTVQKKKETKLIQSLQGTVRSHLANAVKGVKEGWAKELEVNGAGFRAEVRGKDLVLTVGHSHPVPINLPDGVTASVEKNIVTITGADKGKVGQVSAVARGVRPPNPYTGSGIKYVDEVIRRKAGKQTAKTE